MNKWPEVQDPLLEPPPRGTEQAQKQMEYRDHWVLSEEAARRAVESPGVLLLLNECSDPAEEKWVMHTYAYLRLATAETGRELPAPQAAVFHNLYERDSSLPDSQIRHSWKRDIERHDPAFDSFLEEVIPMQHHRRTIELYHLLKAQHEVDTLYERIPTNWENKDWREVIAALGSFDISPTGPAVNE